MIEEAEHGTVLSLGSGVTATVAEGFLSVVSEFAPDTKR